MSYSFNRVEIDLAALVGNYLEIRAVVGEQVRIMAVVKADAYGHGMIRAAQSLYGAGARTFGVAEVEEGALLRESGLEGEVVVLLGTPPESYTDVVRYRLTPVVYDLETLAGLAQRAAAMDVVLNVHLKVDVGMGRLGIMPGEIAAFAQAFKGLPSVRLAGVLSHFPLADEQAADPQTTEHLERFKAALGRLGETGSGGVFHIANSAGLAYHPGSQLDMVRPGIALYGCHPGILPNGDCRASSLTLQPVMSFKTGVIQVKEVPAGTGLSYGHTFVTNRPSRIAVLPVGYDDGYLRRLSNRAEVLIRGQRVPVCGRVCMNACMVDITDLPDAAGVRPGEEVVLLGRQQNGEITADQVAGWLETISYEVLCLFGSRNSRVYIEEG